MKGDNRTTCIEEIWKEFPSFTQYEVRSALAKCGLTTKHIESQVRVLSGGEQAKVRLCKLVNKDTNVPPFGRADQPSGCGCQRSTEKCPDRIQRQHPSDLPRTGILPGRGGRSVGYEPLDYQDLLKKFVTVQSQAKFHKTGVKCLHF